MVMEALAIEEEIESPKLEAEKTLLGRLFMKKWIKKQNFIEKMVRLDRDLFTTDEHKKIHMALFNMLAFIPKAPINYNPMLLALEVAKHGDIEEWQAYIPHLMAYAFGSDDTKTRDLIKAIKEAGRLKVLREQEF